MQQSKDLYMSKYVEQHSYKPLWCHTAVLEVLLSPLMWGKRRFGADQRTQQTDPSYPTTLCKHKSTLLQSCQNIFIIFKIKIKICCYI